MPDGDYIAVLQATGYSGTTISEATENMSLQNIGTFSVNGADITVNNLAVPSLATLSGTATFTGDVVPTKALTITAADSSLPDLGYIASSNYYPGGFSYYPRNTTWTQNPFTGSYSMTLAQNHSFNMALSYSIYTSTTTTAATGTVYYAPTTGTGVQLTGNSNTYKFDLSNLPSPVTLSGRILNLKGTGVAGASGTAILTARSTSIIGANGKVIPGLSYSATVSGDSSGNYTISLLPGYDYQLYYGTTTMQIIQ
jgi:hypothetical protein